MKLNTCTYVEMQHERLKLFPTFLPACKDMRGESRLLTVSYIVNVSVSVSARRACAVAALQDVCEYISREQGQVVVSQTQSFLQTAQQHIFVCSGHTNTILQ